VKKFLVFLSQIGIEAGDKPDLVLQKRVVVYQATLMSAGGLIWSLLAFFYSLKWQSSIPFAYVLLSLLNLSYFRINKNFLFAKNFQTTISLLLPFLFQSSLGGFVASGAAMLWALLSLTVAVLYQGSFATWFWLILYVVLTVLSGIFDKDLQEWIQPERFRGYSLLFFVVNISVISAIILWLVNYMYREKNAAMKKLEETQLQLIQAEKLAALGELTAGIAHEIQNPLNFVNNFSEVNKELAEELEQELEKGNYTDAKSIVKDIRDNEEKISHHGKRADGIVKGMLQHSQISSGQKELTDINALCDEYLRLVYHGLQAKDKTFTAKIETDFDDKIGYINIVPQDIGRVLVNLINNAFYACAERSRASTGPAAGEAGSALSAYEPTVIVSTRKMGDKIEISVKDNGNGIPESIKEKIFQPFFTTKPTGQGTGLGLSLSYDTVKAQGGEIKINSKEGEGTEFIIQLS